MTSRGDNSLSDVSRDQISSWQKVDWKQVNRNVKHLSDKIYTCCENKNFKKVKRLQKLMLNSDSNLLHSIRKVTQQNTGKYTPGMDEQLALKLKERLELFYEMKNEVNMGAQTCSENLHSKTGWLAKEAKEAKEAKAIRNPNN